MGLHVHEYGAVHLATTSRELIYSQYPRCWRRWLRQPPHQLQQGGAAGGQPEALTQALTWSTAERQPHLLQRNAQRLRPAGIARDHVGRLSPFTLAIDTPITASVFLILHRGKAGRTRPGRRLVRRHSEAPGIGGGTQC